MKRFISKYSLEILCVMLAFMLFLSGCSPAGEEIVQLGGTIMWKQINMEEAMELMKTGENYIILDVRRADEFASGHIPGAELPDKDQMILVYCRSGNRSKQASQKLADLGYTNVIEFGGILDWPGEIEY